MYAVVLWIRRDRVVEPLCRHAAENVDRHADTVTLPTTGRQRSAKTDLFYVPAALALSLATTSSSPPLRACV